MFSNVKMGYFAKHFNNARQDSELITLMTSEFEPGVRGTLYFHWSDGFAHAGYAVRSDGELVYVFSTARGMGDKIMADAIANGAVYLDCFDGHLTTLYGRHGFNVVATVPNWTPGEPDVVYMALPGFEDRHGVAA